MPDRNTCRIVNTTLPTARAAGTLAREIVDARLAACAQHFPIHSVYRWKGAVESAAESMLVAKTTARLAPALVAFVRERHPYELPEILVTRIDGGLPDYLRWIARETKDAGRAAPP